MSKMILMSPQIYGTLNADSSIVQVHSGKLAGHEHEILCLVTSLMIILRVFSDSFSVNFILLITMVLVYGVIIAQEYFVDYNIFT